MMHTRQPDGFAGTSVEELLPCFTPAAPKPGPITEATPSTRALLPCQVAKAPLIAERGIVHTPLGIVAALTEGVMMVKPMKTLG